MMVVLGFGEDGEEGKKKKKKKRTEEIKTKPEGKKRKHDYLHFLLCSKTLAIIVDLLLLLSACFLSLSGSFDPNPQIRLRGWRVFGSSK
ncbi:hypothetical protein VNO78_21215 [Psophocarpus tetragonolobus]|uniref:Transmembrane protein n=1 Tax=Psophocarpus tetragonolobus TaxID=3891 RepID=A0AAN9XI65_PSOTE